MTASSENSRLPDVVNEDKRVDLIKHDHSSAPRDWLEERKRRSPPDTDSCRRDRSLPRDRDRDRNEDRHRGRERSREWDRERHPVKRSFRSPGRTERMGPKSPERERDHRRERDERGRGGDSKDVPRHRDRSYERGRRRSADRTEDRYVRERYSPPHRGSRDSYHEREKEREVWRRERSREPPNLSLRRSPHRDRKQVGSESHREYSPRSRPRSPSHRRREESPHYRDYSLRRSPPFSRDPNAQRRGGYEKDTYPKLTDRLSPLRPGVRNENYFDPRERDSYEREMSRGEYSDDRTTPRGRPAKNVFDRISSRDQMNNKLSNSSQTPENRRRVSSAGNRVSRVNQHYPENTVSTLRDLSDRPLKREREEPPPVSTVPPDSWVEEKKARIRSRVEPEDVLDMELIILSEKQREYAEKVEQRIRHMGVTTSLITLPPSMGVAESLDRAVRRNLLYAIIILPQHEQHNSITLTILHGRNPQEHKNMPLEDSLCLINIDHQKYEEAIRDRIIQPRDAPDRMSNKDLASSPHSTPEKPSLDLEQLSNIVKQFPTSKPDLNQNSKDLQAKILGLLGSSAILPSNSDNSKDAQHHILESNLTQPSITSPMSPFGGPMPGYPPMGPPNLMHGFPQLPFNFPTGSISPMHFHPPGAYMHHPNMFGHPPPFHTGFFPRP
eukprot:TRINITY_DN11863_c0_g1_i1.p1 TRINITY_DN11863_c0_g1~~TRINITY_DN11863_c0_g1_i1.p1  ORF type:complete len:711 (-),score=182.84 TRINITY_DN11863_c0_g1_i1:147-2153(-)